MVVLCASGALPLASIPDTISAGDSAGAPRVDMADLKRKSVRNGLITLASQGVTVAIQLASTIVLARLVSPDDYGIVAMVAAITGFAGLFRDLGLSAAAIQKGTLNQEEMSNLFWMNVGMGAALTVVLAAASPLVGLFYGKAELVEVTLLLSTTFLIGSLGTQHGALMQRELWLGRRTVAGVAGSLASLVVSIALASKGLGYWALAWGSVVGALLTTCLLVVLSPFRPGRWTRGADIRSMLRFGANVTAFDIVNYVHRNLDNILIGRFWGADPLGLYNRAYQLLMFPIANLRGPVNAVAFPALSRLQQHPKEFRSYYLNATSLLAVLSMPLTAFLFVSSAPLIELVLGRQWLGVSPIFSWLAVAAFIQPTSGFAGSLLLSLGQGRRYLQCGVFNAVLLSIAIGIGLPWGAVGVAASYAVGNYLVLYPWLVWAYKDSPVTFVDFVRACALPAAVSVVAAAVSWLSRPHLAELAPFVQIGAYLAIFGLISGGALFTKSARSFVQLAAGILKQAEK